MVFRFLNQEVDFSKKVYDGLFLHSLEDIYKIHKHEHPPSEIAEIFTNIQNRIALYLERNLPVCILSSSNSSKKNEEKLLSLLQENNLQQLIGFMFTDDNHLIVRETGFGARFHPSLNANSTVEVGGHYGGCCVWITARGARNVVTNLLPSDNIHPNVLDCEHCLFPTETVKMSIINPDITQGARLLQFSRDKQLISLAEFPCMQVRWGARKVEY